MLISPAAAEQGPRALDVPTLRADAERLPFPWLPAAVPVLLAAVLWAGTGSTLAWLLAAFGPVGMAAGYAEGAWQRRRRRRRAVQRHAEQLAAFEREVLRAHDAERDRAWAQSEAAVGAVRRWRRDPPDPVTVVVGAGTRGSALILTSGERGVERDPAVDALRSRAARLTQAPIVADVSQGISVAGGGVLVRAVLAALLLQIVRAVPPDRARLRVHGSIAEAPWLDALPHGVERRPDAVEPGQWVIEVLHAGPEDRPLPPLGILVGSSDGDAGDRYGCSVSFRVASPLALFTSPPPGRRATRDSAAEDSRKADGFMNEECVPALLSEPEALALAIALRAVAVSSGFSVAPALPERVHRDELGTAPPGSPGLPARIGLGEDGPFEIDLVSEGPHALVGGASGSGKSELLLAWVAGLVEGKTESELVFLLVDFKGGATFRRLAEGSHCLGLITDLSPAEADRVLQSLRAEVRRRERTLAREGCRDILDLPAGTEPRLVIVVDEYQAVIEMLPEMRTVFADIASRGRALGVHLILCTQRPAAVVADAISANCGIRVGLRMHDPGELVALLGRRAAERAPDRPGRALVVRDGRAAVPIQVALLEPEEAGAVARGRDRAVRIPWLDPLPEVLDREHALRLLAEAGRAYSPSPGGLLLGVLDDPGDLTRRVVELLVGGHVLAVGGPASGKSGLLRALHSASAAGGFPIRHLSRSPELFYRQLTGIGEDPGPGTVLIDDLDALIGSLEAEHRTAALEVLTRLLRGRGAADPLLVMTSRTVSPALAALAGHVPLVLLLRTRGGHEAAALQVPAGGDASGWSPGRFSLEGKIGQLIHVPGTAPADELSSPPLDPEGLIGVVTRSRSASSKRIAAACPRSRIVDLSDLAPGVIVAPPPDGPGVALLGDPEQWQSRWPVLQDVRRRGHLLFDGCTAQDLRLLTRTRLLPPPLRSGDGEVWWDREGENVQVRRWPLARPAAAPQTGEQRMRQTTEQVSNG